MYKLYKYEKAKEVVRRNIKRCMEYVKSHNKYDPYTIGECYGNIVLYKNNFSINIRKEIEKIKYSSEEDFINTIKSYKIN